MEDVSLNGCILSPYDERDYRAKDYIARGAIPEAFIEDEIDVEYQGDVSSCMAYAVALSKAIQRRRWARNALAKYGIDPKAMPFKYKYSTDYIYHSRRSTDSQRPGMIARECLSQRCKVGRVKFELLPTNTEYPNAAIKRFVDALADEAAKDKTLIYYRCEDMDDIREVFYEVGSVVVIVKITASFKAFMLKNADNWVLPIPKPDEKEYGYHAIAVVGFDKDGIVIQNSWGKYWGFNGRAVIPWDYEIPEVWGFEDEMVDYDVIELNIDDTTAFINGKSTQLDVPATIIKDRAMVPIRFIAEALGCEVEYLSDSRKVIIRRAINGGNN